MEGKKNKQVKNEELAIPEASETICEICNEKCSSESCSCSRMKKKHGIKENIPACELCNKSFSRLSDLTKHHKKGCAEGTKDLNCKTCNIKFASSSNLTRHMKRFHRLNSTSSGAGDNEKEVKVILQCTGCMREFTRRCDLTRHQQFCSLQSSPDKLYCKECKIHFNHKSSHFRHFRRKHGKSKLTENKVMSVIHGTACANWNSDNKDTHSGALLEDSADINKTLKKVIKESDDSETESCFHQSTKGTQGDDEHCMAHRKHEILQGDIQTNVKSDDTHEGTIEEKGLRIGKIENYECETCGKSFSSNNSLCCHKRSHYTKRRCKECKEFFRVGSEWNEHLKSHKSEKMEKLFCHICGNSFQSYGGFHKHMKRHAGVVYSCKLCMKKFTASHTLKIHMLRHKGEKPYICEVCGARFSQQSHLSRHSTTHTGERKYHCETCHKAFSDATNLKLHERVHSGYRPYECSLCSKTFAQLSAMKAHKKTHFMKRDFQCDICERTFTQKHSLLRHKAMHLKKSETVKPAFVTKPTLFCNKCPRGFTTRRGLVRHMQKHTKGILPVLRREPIEEGADEKSRNVPSLISSVHGHYQSKRDKLMDKDSNQQENHLIAENLNSEYKKHTAYTSHKTSVITCASLDEQNVNTGHGVSDINKNETRALPCTTSYFQSPLQTHTLPKEKLNELDKPAEMSNFSDLNVSKNVVITTYYDYGIQDPDSDSYAVLNVPVADMREKDHLQTLESTPMPVSRVEYHDINGPDVVQRNIHQIAGTGSGNHMTVIEVPHEYRKNPTQFQDPTNGLNTLSNVVCNLEGGTKAGWESFRFSDQQKVKAGYKLSEEEAAAAGKQNKIILTVEDKLDKNSSSQTECFDDDEEIVSHHEKKVVSDDETIVGDYDMQPDALINVVESCNKNQSMGKEREPGAYVPVEQICNNNAFQLHKTNNFTDRNVETVEKETTSEKITVIKLKTDMSQNELSKAHEYNCLQNNEKEAGKVTSSKTKDIECQVQCLKCSTRFCSFMNLKKHMKLQCERRFETKLPERNESNEVVETKTIQEEHPEESIANTKDQVTEEINIKEEKENKSGKYKCSYCHKSFALLNSFKFHEQKHKEPAKFVCDICGKGFYKAYHLKRHLQQHENHSDQTCFCDKCGKMFQKESLLKTHIRLHMGLDPFPCNLCSKSFRHGSNLKRHLKSHVDGREETAVVHSFFCDLCGKGFTASTSLQVHLNRHNGIKPYQCTLCSSAFAQSGHLKRHIKSHSGIKTIKCELCEKMFYDASTLKVHMRSHSGEKPYKCHTCGKAFTQVQNLRVHERKHEGIKLYKCDLCEQEFTTKMSLLRHEKRHKREELMDSETKNKRYMTVKKMKDKVVPCPNCDRYFTTRKSMLAHCRQACTHEQSSASETLKIVADQSEATKEVLHADNDNSEVHMFKEVNGSANKQWKESSQMDHGAKIKHFHNQIDDSAPVHDNAGTYLGTKSTSYDINEQVNDPGVLHKKDNKKRKENIENDKRKQNFETKEAVQMDELTVERTHLFSQVTKKQIPDLRTTQESSSDRHFSREKETPVKMHTLVSERIFLDPSNSTRIFYQPAGSASVLYKEVDNNKLHEQDESTRHITGHYERSRKFHEEADKIRIHQPLEQGFLNERKQHESVDNTADSMITFMPRKCGTKTFTDVSEPAHIKIIDRRDELNPRSPDSVTPFMEDESELSIVHVVEEVPYTEIVIEEASDQNRYTQASGEHQDYSESIHFSNLSNLSHFTSHAISTFVNSSTSSPASSLAVSSLPSSNVITPIFPQSVIGVPLNLVTLGPVSTLQMEHVSQDQYFHQEPQWRMPCP